MKSIAIGMKMLPWVAVGLVPLLGLLPLEAAVGPDSPETPPLSAPTTEPPPDYKTGEYKTGEYKTPDPYKTGDYKTGDYKTEPLRTPTIAVQETAQEVKIELPADVLFDFDKWDLRPDAEATLQQVAEIIQRYPKAKITVAGYTDAKGAETYNLQLSERRAKSVKAWLVQQGSVNGQRMTTKGWGEAKPVAPNTHPDGSDNPEGRQQNRRVELTVKK